MPTMSKKKKNKKRINSVRKPESRYPRLGFRRQIESYNTN